MTENEAIDKLKNMRLFMQIEDNKNECKFAENDYLANKMAIQALEEVQQYRQIGSVEPFAETKKLSDLTKKCGTIGKVFDECAEYAAIGTVEECRKSVEICKSMIGRNITPENMEEYMKFDD